MPRPPREPDPSRPSPAADSTPDASDMPGLGDRASEPDSSASVPRVDTQGTDSGLSTTRASGERSVAIGGDVSSSTIVTGDTYQLALRRRTQMGVALAGLVLLAAAAVVIYQFAQARASVPTRMSGNVKVAVAQFGVSPRGSQAESDRAAELARQLHARVESQFGALTSGPTPLSVQVWPPGATGPIAGATRDERVTTAANRAQAIGADVILYGNVDLAAGSAGFTPEFFLAESSLSGAEELAGWYALGPRIEAGRDFLSNPATFERMLQDTLARTRPLPPFLYGRGYFQNDDFATADRYFELAVNGWPDDGGKEVLYLFRGNVAGQIAARASTPRERDESFARAREHFDAALRVNPNYARAQLGSAEVLVQVYGAQRDCAAQQVDVPQLERALTIFQQAADAPDQPPLANVRAKAHLGRGRAALCLSQAEAVDRWADAERDLQAVVREFETAEPAARDRLQPLAAQAYGSLALVYWPAEGDPSPDASYARVAAALERATALTSDPPYRARAQQLLAEVERRKAAAERTGPAD